MLQSMIYGSASKSKGGIGLGPFDDGVTGANMGGSADQRYMTPEKQSQLNSDLKRKMSSPESMFTPLKIPGSTKDDNYAKSK